MAKGTFGEQLKREREMRGVSLDEISAATRIAPKFLHAIENEQWDQLPGGVFNRGFVRAVAHYLGLDEESIVAEYGMVAGVRPSVPVWTGSPPAVTPSQPWLAWILAAVIAIALIAGGVVGIRRIAIWRASHHAGEIATPDEPSAQAASVPPDPAPAISDDRSPAVPAPPVAPDPPSSPSAVVNATPAAPALPLQLKIETETKTRVTVATDTQRAFDGNILPGEARTFSAQDRFQISTKNAGALQLQLNGKMLAPMGQPGKSGKITLTRESLKEASGGAN